jgi:preprotein translocase subunit SecY
MMLSSSQQVVGLPVGGVGPRGKAMSPSWRELWQASGLQSKLIFTLLMVLAFRFVAQIPIWGLNTAAIQQILSSQLVGFLDIFSGGGLAKLSILALGIGPYITASIVMQLMTVVIPRLEEMQKEEGESGRKKVAQYTRYLTLGLALFQSVVVVKLLTMAKGVLLPGFPPMLVYAGVVLSLVTGALFTLWLSELITERGIGNGSSILIFIGILASLPLRIGKTVEYVGADPQKSFQLVLLLAVYLLILVLIIYLNEGVRKVFILHARRRIGQRVLDMKNTFIPFRINSAGVMPVIFAFALLTVPSALVEFLQQGQPKGMLFDVLRFYQKWLAFGTPLHTVLEFALIVFFSYFYNSIVPSMQPKDIAEQLRKSSSTIPGVKPGRPTEEYLGKLLNRITLIGAVALSVIVLMASAGTMVTGIVTLQGLGSTSLIILVGVALDLVNQVRVHLLAQSYQGFLTPGAPNTPR